METVILMSDVIPPQQTGQPSQHDTMKLTWRRSSKLLPESNLSVMCSSSAEME